MQSVDKTISGLLAGEYRTPLASDGKKRLWGILTIGDANEWNYKFVVESAELPATFYSLASAIRKFDTCKA